MKDRLLKAIKKPGFQRYAANSLWVVSEKLLRMITMLFVGIWVARFLGPQSFGILSFAQSFVFLFSAFSTLGFDSIVVRELVKGDIPKDQLLGCAFLMKLVGALIIIPIMMLIIYLSSEDRTTIFIVFIIATSLILQSFNVIDFYFQSKVLSKYVSLVNSSSMVVSSIAKIIFIINEATLIYFALIILFDALIVTVGLVYCYRFYAREFLITWAFDLPIAKFLIQQSWPLFLSGILISFYMKIDQVMLNFMMNKSSVGVYAAAVKLSEAWYMIPMVIVSSLFPAIISAKKHSSKMYEKRLLRLYTLMVWFGLTIAIIITLSSNWLIHTLYGSSYHEAVTILSIHIWAGVFVFLGVAFSKYLVAEGLAVRALYRTLSGAILNIILNLVLIPIYGIIGAAVATLISQIVANMLYDVFDYRLRSALNLKLIAFNPLHKLHRE